MAGVGATTRRTLQAEPRQDRAATEVDTVMRRFADQSRGDGAEQRLPTVPVPLAPTAGAPRDIATATDLLDRASLAFDTLIDRCQGLERDLEEEADRARAKATERDDAVAQWQRLASGLKAQAETLARTTAALKDRFEAAEARAVSAERRAAALERVSAEALDHATLAERQATRLRGKVMELFGRDSRAHPVLEALELRMTAPSRP